MGSKNPFDDTHTLILFRVDNTGCL